MPEINGKLNNKPINFTHIAIGDANDVYVQPSRTQTTLVNEITRIPVTGMEKITPSEPDGVPQLKVWAKIPDDIVDIAVREFAAVATFDGNSYLHAVGNSVRIPILSGNNNGGEVNDIFIEMTFAVTSLEPIVMIDPAIVTATRKYVQEQIAPFEKKNNAASDIDIDEQSTASKHIKLPQLWRALGNEDKSRPKGASFTYSEPSMPSEGGWYTILEGLTEYSNCPLMGVINTVGHRSVTFIVHRANVNGTLQILQSQGATKNGNNCHLDGIRLADDARKLQVKLLDVSKPLVMNVSLVSPNPTFSIMDTPTLETGNPDVSSWFSPLPSVGNDQCASVFSNLFVGDSTDSLFQVISSKELAGIPLPFPLGTVPSGWLECRGQSFNTSSYPKLAERYPSGVLPDLRGEFIRGYDNGRGIDVDRDLLSLQLDAFQDHQHTYHTFRRTGNEEELLTPERNFSVVPQTTTGAINGRTADETRPRNIAYMYIVRAA